jgi:heme oxygenase
MESTATIMTRLREETAAAHKYAETRALQRDLFRGQLPRVAYVHFLQQRLPVHAALEASLSALAARDPRVGTVVHPRQFQADNVRSDLAQLGAAGAAEPLAATRAWIAALDEWAARRPLRLLGAHYVLEGSKNGAHFLAPRVQSAYGLTAAQTRYLDPHGEQQRPLWAGFKAAMDAIEFTPEEMADLVAAAQETFAHASALDDAVYQPAAHAA